jgi:hypothetical protein
MTGCPSLANYRERHYYEFDKLPDMSTGCLNRLCLPALTLVVSTVAPFDTRDCDVQLGLRV